MALSVQYVVEDWNKLDSLLGRARERLGREPTYVWCHPDKLEAIAKVFPQLSTDVRLFLQPSYIQIGYEDVPADS